MPKAKHTVLLVDDSPFQSAVTEKVLEPLGVDIIKAESGEEALERFQQDSIFLILMDVMMGGINGFETARHIRDAEHSNRSVPIIFITGSMLEPKAISEGYSVGAVDYLFKPFDPFSLRTKVEVFLEIAQQGQLIKDQLKEIEAKNIQLEKHLEEINLLSGLVPICASCKDIRDVSGYWQTIEQYFSTVTETQFSHSICPGCREKLYPDIAKG